MAPPRRKEHGGAVSQCSAVIVVSRRCDDAGCAAPLVDRRLGARASAVVHDVRIPVAHPGKTAAIEAGAIPVTAGRAVRRVTDVVHAGRLVVATFAAVAQIPGAAARALAIIEMIGAGI